jgi:hypothetical protein
LKSLTAFLEIAVGRFYCFNTSTPQHSLMDVVRSIDYGLWSVDLLWKLVFSIDYGLWSMDFLWKLLLVVCFLNSSTADKVSAQHSLMDVVRSIDYGLWSVDLLWKLVFSIDYGPWTIDFFGNCFLEIGIFH